MDKSLWLFVFMCLFFYACGVVEAKKKKEDAHHREASPHVPNKDHVNTYLQAPPHKEDTCTTCKFVVGLVNGYITVYNKTVQDMLTLIDEVCQLVSGDLAESECHIITKSMDAIVAWLREKETSAAICISLGLCNEYNMKFPDWKKVAALRQAVSKSEIIRKLHKELPKMQAPKVKGHYTQ